MPILLATVFLSSVPLMAPLGDGNIIYLSQISDDPETRAWTPDGTPMPPLPDINRNFGGLRSTLSNGELEVELSIRLRQQPADLTGADGSRYAWQPTFAQLEPASISTFSLSSAAVFVSKGTFQCRRFCRKPPHGSAFSLTVRVADSQWKTVATAFFHKATLSRGPRFISAPTFVSGAPAKLGKAFPFHIPLKWKDDDVRIIGFDASGKCCPSGGEMRTAGTQKYMWFTCPTNEVVRVELGIRPFKTVVFKGIQSVPKA